MAPSPRKRAADIDHDYTPTAKQARLARSNSRPSSSSSSTHAERTLPPKFPSSQLLSEDQTEMRWNMAAHQQFASRRSFIDPIRIANYVRTFIGCLIHSVSCLAERLSWDDKLVAMPDKDRNEELNWAVNYELGILDPFVEDAENIPGGKNSRYNRFYPYRNEYEMKLAFKLIFMSEELSATSWALWISAQMHLQTMLEGGEQMDASPSAVLPPPTRMKDERLPTVTPAQQGTREPIETIDLTGSPEPVPKPTTGRSYGLSTPPSSLSKSPHSIAVAGGSHRKDGVYKTVAASIANFEEAGGPSTEPSPLRQIESYKTLQDFYSLLDKIERTSYVGALFLEAYAEKLRDDMCKDCWFKHNVNVDLF
ncbi:hypothetical protein SNOG_06456 [Parastagonospora nodorum SN15]|uniref:Uncharacterized protein n=1 Tax=Phaeosphaeria nodorum (strain SN15 / ATCC MYA-4574 / FGSC 10173) TaxID=321614 RepID=Q0UP58_PHANO|nr:hypothetical protein SNOG_06456 [Parastagonospora nodorum SN15]EAT86287.1 hypothetical protein SNOG_06456 [Parastagonospora nodorum SN15]